MDDKPKENKCRQSKMECNLSDTSKLTLTSMVLQSELFISTKIKKKKVSLKKDIQILFH